MVHFQLCLMPPRKRAATVAQDDTATSKKYKSAMDEMAEEWVCPITFELPFDPVTAEDGHVYERSAIEELIRVKGAALNSPMTNVKMGRRLMPSKQARNTIEKLVRSGAIGGDKAERWLERLSDEELVKATRLKAEGGDVDAINKLAIWYIVGTHGLVTDCVAAVRLFEQGAKLDDVRSICMLGKLYACGLGTEENEALGLCLTTQAAVMGSKHACSNLGDWHYFGRCGLPEDKERARYWYRKVAACEVDDLSESNANKAAERAQEVEG